LATSSPRDSRFNDREASVTQRKKPLPKEGEYSAFKTLLDKLVKVPKREIDEKEAQYQRERERLRKKAR
jgi:hypothetical protein